MFTGPERSSGSRFSWFGLRDPKDGRVAHLRHRYAAVVVAATVILTILPGAAAPQAVQDLGGGRRQARTSLRSHNSTKGAVRAVDARAPAVSASAVRIPQGTVLQEVAVPLGSGSAVTAALPPKFIQYQNFDLSGYFVDLEGGRVADDIHDDPGLPPSVITDITFAYCVLGPTATGTWPAVVSILAGAPDDLTCAPPVCSYTVEVPASDLQPGLADCVAFRIDLQNYPALQCKKPGPDYWIEVDYARVPIIDLGDGLGPIPHGGPIIVNVPTVGWSDDVYLENDPGNCSERWYFGGCPPEGVIGCGNFYHEVQGVEQGCRDDADCDDNDKCTFDWCELDTGLCFYDPIAGCCSSDDQCPPDPKCSDSFCNQTTNQCQLSDPVPGCCESDQWCGKCELCDTATNTCYRSAANCCVSNNECGKCELCDTATNTCYRGVLNCCTSDAECTECELCDLATNACIKDAIACDDGDDCTDDYCDQANGRCVHEPIPGCGEDEPCSHCPKGDHWVDQCPEGMDHIRTGALVGLSLTGGCVVEMNLVLGGPATIKRSDPYAGAGGTHNDRIDTEIVSMQLTGGGVTLKAGSSYGLPPSLGKIVEQPDPEKQLADSYFDVFVVIDDKGGLSYYNHDPLRLNAKINCIPPDSVYFHPALCPPLALYDVPPSDPPDPTRQVVAYLVTANHDPAPECGSPAAGDCNEEHDTPFCDDQACCKAVCDILPHCCDVMWDVNCVDEAHNNVNVCPMQCCLPDGLCIKTSKYDCEFNEGSPVRQCPEDERCIPPGKDCWNTPCGETRYSFAKNPIPAGFFGSSSEPFDGTVRLGGASEPGGAAGFTTADTVIARTEAMAPALGGEPERGIPIELVALSLRSCEPIHVVMDAGMPDTLWNVEVDLSAQRAPLGEMEVAKTHENGGTFHAAFHVQPKFTFTLTDASGFTATLVLDTADTGKSPARLETIGESHWVHEDIEGVVTSKCTAVNFIPGVDQDPLMLNITCTPTGHAGPGHLHVTGQICVPKPEGACCNTANGSCVIAEGQADCNGVYKGDGTDCRDRDGDGLADWFETNDCNDVKRNECNTGTDPNNPDTDGDGLTDGFELKETKCDPCVPDSVDLDGNGIPDACGEEHYVKFSQPPKSTAHCPCEGDLNKDTFVTVADLAILTLCLQTGDCAGCVNSCDINCDGTVALGDIVTFNCLLEGGTPEECCPKGPQGEDYPSDMSWRGADVTNQAAADDFVSDGRPITAVRWWGSNMRRDHGIEVDYFPDTEAVFDINNISTGASETIELFGPTTVHVDLGSLGDKDNNGLEEVPTEIVEMELTGNSALVGPVTVRVRPATSEPLERSVGQIEEKVNDIPGVLELPPFTATGTASSYFEVYFEIEAAGLTLHTIEPKRMSTQISHKPPAEGETYQNPQVIALYDENNVLSDFVIKNGSHVPNPGKVCREPFGPCGNPNLDCKCFPRPDETNNCADSADLATCLPCQSDTECTVADMKCFIVELPSRGCCAYNCGEAPTDPKVCAGWEDECPDPEACSCTPRPDGTFNCVDDESLANCPPIPCYSDSDCDTISPGSPGMKCFGSPGTEGCCAYNCGEVPAKVCYTQGDVCGDTTLNCICTKRIDGSLNCADQDELNDPCLQPCSSDTDCTQEGTKCFVPEDATGGCCAHNCGDPATGGAASDDLGGAARKAAEFAGLRTIAQNEGSVRVIAELAVPNIDALLAASRAARGAVVATQADGQLKTAIDVVVQPELGKLAGLNYTVNRTYDSIPFVALTVPLEALNALEASAGIVGITEDTLAKPLLDNTVHIVGASTSWAKGADGTGWTVAVLDTGIRATHEFFAGKTIQQACFALGQGSLPGAGDCPNGTNTQIGGNAAQHHPAGFTGWAHGTHVTGIAVGNGPSIPSAGVAKGADIIAVQVFSRFTSKIVCDPNGVTPMDCVLTWFSDVTKGLDHVYSLRFNKNIAAVNMSLGGGKYDNQADCDAAEPAMKASIDNLRAAGIASVAASGNDGNCNGISMPACISSAIAVGATDDSDVEASFSNWDPNNLLDLYAPGVAVLSSHPNTDSSYASWNGTSMATPHVAGAWAILKQATAGASVQAIFDMLQGNGQTIAGRCVGVFPPQRRIQIDAAINSKTPLPDGWFISFHEHQQKQSAVSQDEPLALYYCDPKVVNTDATELPDCQDHKVLEYFVNLDDCCLVHSSVDSRTGHGPALKNGFYEEKSLAYHIDIQAVVGVEYWQDKETGVCIEKKTGRSAANHFWGWHTTVNENGINPALQTMVKRDPVGGESLWLYGPWDNIEPKCQFRNMAFELLTDMLRPPTKGKCEQCPPVAPGEHLIDNDVCTPGLDRLKSGALVGISFSDACDTVDTTLVLGGPVFVEKIGPLDDSGHFPNTRLIDGHHDVFDTEIMTMRLTGRNGITLTAGAKHGLHPTYGVIAEQTTDPSVADSFFDVFFKVDLGGGLIGYNWKPLRLESKITCIPPNEHYLHPVMCPPLPLYDRKKPDPNAVVVAYLVSANHEPFVECGSETAGNCFERNGTPYCDNAECCSSVCGQAGFEYCCDVGWDQACADAAWEKCVPRGACCDNAVGYCIADDITESECLSIAEQPKWFFKLTCEAVEEQGLCVEHTGACCDKSIPECTDGVPESACSVGADPGGFGICGNEQACSDPCPAAGACRTNADCAPGATCESDCIPSTCNCEMNTWTCTADCNGRCVIPDQFRWFKDTLCSEIRCEQAPFVESWESVGTHERGVPEDPGDIGLEITPDGLFSEPRRCADRIILSLSGPIDPATAIPANVACTGRDVGDNPVACSPMKVTTTAGDTQLVITFNPKLTDFARYTVVVGGLRSPTGKAIVASKRCFTMLVGDANNNRRVTNGDLSFVRANRGALPTDVIDPANEDEVRSDVTCDGRVRNSDLSLVRSVRGNDAREIPCP